VETLEAIGTEEALQKALSAVSSLIDLDSPAEAKKLEQTSRTAARLAGKLGEDKKSYYADIAAVCQAVPDWFEMHQQARPGPVGRSSYEVVRRLPALARKLWIAETMRRLDLAAKQEKEDSESYIHDGAVRAVEDIFSPELVPALERVARESRARVESHGRYKVAKFFNVRSLAAAILTEKTGQQHTFIDIDGQTHPGGWDPSQEQ
jgi:hypothetical protein